MFHTPLTKMFAIDYPVLCGSMMWLADPALCAAVSEAGGMGNLTCGNYLTEDELRAAIAAVRAQTDKPFILGLTLMPSVRITPEINRMYVRVAADEQVAAMEVSGAPMDRALGLEYLPLLHDAGVKVFHKVGCLKHALHAQKAGYDGVYCLGYEAGGHPHADNVTSLVLTARMCAELTIPVVTVGGMADGRGLAAALSLGAAGIMMGSRFLCTRECMAHPAIKQHIVDARETDTALFGAQALGMQGRALKNNLVAQIMAVEEAGGGLEELFPLISGERVSRAWQEGTVDDAPFMVGESIGLIDEVLSCRELLESIADDARQSISRAAVSCGLDPACAA